MFKIYFLYPKERSNMDKYTAQQVMNGTWGELWIDGTYMAEVTAFEAKVSLDKTDVNMTS